MRFDSPSTTNPIDQLKVVGQPLDRERIEKAARSAADDDVSPQSDVRSTADYRREVLYRIVRRLLIDLTVTA